MKVFEAFKSILANRADKKARRITTGNNITHTGTTITLTQARRFGSDIGQYIVAVYSADNIDYSRRAQLLDMYTDISTDTHVISVVTKRRSGVLSMPIEFRRDSVPVEEINMQIRSPWFINFLQDAIDSRFWGFSLMQFYRNEKGWIDYDLIPRKHVNLINNEILCRQSDLRGEPFESFDNLLLIRDKNDLGLYCSLCPWVIWKRDSSSDWAQFSELFGMPIRKYTYDAADPDALANAVQAASEQGGAATFFCPTGTNLELVESGNNGTSSALYSDRIDRCNAEISKAVLGNTLSTEAGDKGTQALGTVHAKEEESISNLDRQFILNLLNYEMTDIFASLGLNTKGGNFVYVDTSSSASKIQNLKTCVLEFGLPVDPDYIYETLGIEKPADFKSEDWQFQRTLVSTVANSYSVSEEDGNNGGEDINGGNTKLQVKNRLRGFFAQAPRHSGISGAFEW